MRLLVAVSVRFRSQDKGYILMRNLSYRRKTKQAGVTQYLEMVGAKFRHITGP